MKNLPFPWSALSVTRQLLQFRMLIRTICICVVMTLPPAAHAASHEFHVSPVGNDRSPGSLDKPFKTISRARDAVRSLRRSNPNLTDTVRVFLHEGRYHIDRPIELGLEDGGTPQSPTLYAAFAHERPVVSGGVRVSGWRPSTFDGKRVWTAPLPQSVRMARPRVQELWINGARRNPARHPNKGYLAVASVPDVKPATEWMDGQTSFAIKPGDIPREMDFSGGHVVATTRWVESHLPITSYSPGESLFRFSRRTVFRTDPGDLYYVLHARGAFDTPGEWWLDAKRGRLFYYPLPGESIKTLDAVVPLLTQILLVHGDPGRNRWVEHLQFRGITFSHAEWFFPKGYSTDSRNPDAGGFNQAATGVPAAISCEGMRFGTFLNCTVAHVGTYAIAMGAACTDNTIQECELMDLGAGGVFIGIKSIENDAGLLTSRNRILDNHIHGGGQIFHSAIGVWIGQSPRNRIVHNHIHDFFYTGISIGWTWGYGQGQGYGNLVELNHVHHIGVLSDGDGPILSDLGGIYTLGYQRGTIIRRNIFHDIAARVYGGWGIYFDEGSTGALAENNLVYRTLHGGFHQHYGKENIFRNNILAFGKEYQIRRDRVEPHTSFAFENNIVLWSGDKLFYGNLRDGDLVFDRNLYWPMKGEFRADSLTFAEWQALGFDAHSRVGDPLFMDPASDDYRLKPESPALALGFKPFDLSAAVSATPVGDILPPRPAPGRLIYNNDGSNILMAFDTLTLRRAYQRIDPLAGTGVSTFLHNVNPGQNPGYPSSVESMYHWESPPPNATGGWNQYGRRMSDNLERLVRDSLDPVGVVMDRARLRGMGAFLSFRMNELHDVDKPESPLLGEFWKAHPEWRVGGYDGWGKEALNYAVPEVREYFYNLLKETVGRYDIEGLELDFMRFPHYFPLRPDSMSFFADILTGFVARVRSMTDSVAAVRGHPILLGVRVPSSLRACAHMAADPASWSTRGLIDFLTVAPFLSTETDIPVQEFKAVCGAVPVYAGLEFTIGDRQMTRPEKRAAAALLYEAGADGIYLFNQFTAWDAGLEMDTKVLAELADPKALDGKDKLYTLAVPWFPVPGISLKSQLPLTLRKAELQTLSVRVHEPVKPDSVVLRIECSEAISPTDLRLVFNGTTLQQGVQPASPQIFPEKIFRKMPDVTKTVEFAIDPLQLKESNSISIHAMNSLRVDWVYLGVIHAR
ncbi:MAG: right-handed parallel beta-helix repeat-containing protein [Bacteroidetes bacterium]|nr:right-handed parallel beta-helix repeat-containing protein [Bacteroidota bacterium]